MEPGRAFHPPATSVTVQAIYDAESIALLVRWHDMSAEKTGKNGPSLPVPPEEEEEPRAAGGARGRAPASKGAPLATRKSPRPRPGRPAPAAPQRTPLPSRKRRQPASHPSSPTPSRSRFLRRCRRAPASPTSSSATPRTRWISGSSIWPAPIPFSSPAREAGTSLPNDTGDLTGVASYDQGEWSVIFKRPLRASLGRPVLARRVHAGRLLGLGRVLARAWQQARSHGLVLPLRRARSGPIGRRPDGEDGAASFSSSSWP